MSVTIDGPADFPALYRSADRESERTAVLPEVTRCASVLCSSRRSAARSP